MLRPPPSVTAWFEPPQPGRTHLLCFPHAGGGAASYRAWSATLAPSVVVRPAHLPGREGRIREPALRSVVELTRLLFPHIKTFVGSPYILFGYSMGAIIAFELARAIQRAGLPGPLHLFVAARESPRTRDDQPLHELPDDAFLARLRAFEGTPEEVFAHSELLELMLPTLRADAALSGTYDYQPGAPLLCPITAMAGTDDPTVPIAEVEDWGQETSGEFRLLRFDGGHFFIRRHTDAILGEIRRAAAAGPA